MHRTHGNRRLYVVSGPLCTIYTTDDLLTRGRSAKVIYFPSSASGADGNGSELIKKSTIDFSSDAVS